MTIIVLRSRGRAAVPRWTDFQDSERHWCQHGAWMRCTGGGEPFLHPQMVDMVEYAKARGTRVWMNTNGSMLGPLPKYRQKLERVLKAGIDLIEFPIDAGDPDLYAVVRPPHRGAPKDKQKWWHNHVGWQRPWTRTCTRLSPRNERNRACAS